MALQKIIPQNVQIRKDQLQIINDFQRLRDSDKPLWE